VIDLSRAALLGGSYLLGSLPFGLFIARAWTGIDIREHGSRNIGATNVYRVVGPFAGSVVFLLDVGKGLAPPLAALALGFESAWQVGAGLCAYGGHLFSPFLGFRGGKGVATALGVLFGVSWKVALGSWALWAVCIALTRIVSVGSIAACLSLAPLSLLFYPGDWARLTFAVVSGGLTLVKHRGNIKRLLRGTEPKLGARPAGSDGGEHSKSDPGSAKPAP
jgi:glycerol-3-phosphate acyltransferase PlsY